MSARGSLRLTRWLERAGAGPFAAYATLSAFSAYFCMYGFRKPFAAGAFEGREAFGVSLKIALVLSQVLGYALSKFVSIKLVSELSPARRVLSLFGAIGMAEAALLLVGWLPPEGKVLAIFFNGLPLGAVWGLVFGFLEGRRTSEILGAGLSMSYIVASGAVKSVGRSIVEAGVPEDWMPAVTGLIFLPPFALAVYLLSRLPAPSAADQAARSERTPMDGRTRLGFVTRYAFGLSMLTVLYVALTAYRDFRDNFAFELWSALGYADEPAILTYSELPVACSVMLALGLIFLIPDNRRAFFAIHAIMLLGAGLLLGSTVLCGAGLLDPAAWMVLVGSGLYLGYVPYGCVLFDRLMAMTRSPGTAVFMIYVTDAAGYAGSVGLLLYKEFGSAELDWLPFFEGLSYATGVVALVGFASSAWYFARPRLGRTGG